MNVIILYLQKMAIWGMGTYFKW